MTKPKRKIIAMELYNAAERIEIMEQIYCCSSIYDEAARILFLEIFRSDAMELHNRGDRTPWFHETGETTGMSEVRSRRVLGLLWAAEMVLQGIF